MSFLFYIMPFVLTCIPGISLGTIKIQAYDFYTIALIPFVVNYPKFNEPIFKEIELIWLLLSSFILLSIFCVQINSEGNYSSYLIVEGSLFSSYLKGIRFLYPLIICGFIAKYFHLIDLNLFKKCCVLSMLLCPAIGIYGYLFQIPSLTAIQTTISNGVTIIRAGSFWNDSGIFGFVCSVFAVFSIYFLISEKIKKTPKHTFLFCGSLILNIIGFTVAFSRSSFLSFLFGTFAYFLFRGTKQKSILLGIGLASLILIPIGVLIYIYNFFPVFNDNINRILLLTTINTSNASTLSSTRTDLWINILNIFFSGPIFFILFGYGYKIDGLFALADNGFLYALTSTGFIGFSLLILFIFRMFTLLKYYFSNIFFDSAYILFLCWIVSMLFADSLTYVPTNIMLFALPLLGFLYKGKEFF